MTVRWIAAGSVFDGEDFRANHAVAIANDRVTALGPTEEIPAGSDVTHHTGVLCAGFFDIQVNGGGGVMLNETPTVEGIATIAAAHRKFGTVALMPTVISDWPAVLAAAAEACVEARALPGIVGLHIEGPHIATSKRGTHAADVLRPLDAETLHVVRGLRDAHLPVLITLAPEAATNAQIATLCEMGAVVSLGHSDAGHNVAKAALAAGATSFTHLFNAMSQMSARAPGMVGAAIMGDAWCSIIADGIHVDPEMIALALRARPIADRMIAVSDAMATVGGPEAFMLYGTSIELRHGRLVNAEGALAGAHLTLLDALRNLIDWGISPVTAMRMCRHNPGSLLGIGDTMSLIGSRSDDLLLLQEDFTLAQVGI